MEINVAPSDLNVCLVRLVFLQMGKPLLLGMFQVCSGSERALDTARRLAIAGQ